MPSSKVWFISKPTKKILLRMESNLPQAIEGDYEALCNLLLILSEAIRHGVPLTEKFTVFIADALRKTADGGDPGEAFHIHRKRGQRDTREEVFRNLQWAGEVKMLVCVKGMTQADAFAQVADDIQQKTGSNHEEAIKKAWGKYRNNIEVSKDGSATLHFGVEQKKVKCPKARK